MTRDETRDIIRTIMEYYPQWKPENLTKVIDDWHEILAAYESDDVKVILKNYIVSSKGVYVPNVSNLIPKKNEVYGFKGRTYTHEWFEALEREIESKMPF